MTRLHRPIAPDHATVPRKRGTTTMGLMALVSIATVFFGCAEGRSIGETGNVCGDGRPRDGEECDDADDNSDKVKDACRTDCTAAHCGDGVKDTGEECDDGNKDLGDGCDKNCQKTYTCGDDKCDDKYRESCSVCADDCCPCGDGVCTVGEQCGVCPEDCCPNCGDGVLDVGEACDDGNNDDGDGCGKGCSDEDGEPTCGNGYLELGEVCDDGNTVGADGCGADCQLEYVCGDQECFSEVGENCETCLADCCPNCGDATVNDFEECDGSIPAGADTCTDLCYAGGSPTCLPNCLLDYTTCEGELPVCGNGIIECGEQCDGDATDGATCADVGREGGPLTCTESCELDTSDCGDILFYLEADFDDGCPDDWTLVSPWQCGAPTGGPGSAYSPPNVLSTGLAGSYPTNGSFFSSVATSPPFNLSLATAPVVTFKMWHAFENNLDGVQVQTSTDGVTFTAATMATPAYGSLGGWSGTSTGWQTFTVALDALIGASEARIRFGFQSDGSVSYAGAFIDDIIVSERCGNGVIDVGEVCDGAAVGAAVCPEGSCGTPLCADDCSEILEGEGCVVPDCGNGVRECDEQCDDNDFDGQDCDALGYDGGDLGCTNACEYDVGDCGDLTSLLPLQGFETCPPAGWTLTGIWECGIPTSGPNSANSGTRVVATNLDGDYTNSLTWEGNYVQTPAFVVAGPSPTLSFAAWLRSEDLFDGMRLEVSTDGATWSVLSAVTPAYTDADVGLSSAWDGDLTAWAPYTADLSAYDGETIRIRFSFFADGSSVYAGAYVDDVVAVPSPDLIPVVMSSVPDLGEIFTGQPFSLALSALGAGDVEYLITGEDNGAWLDVDADTGVLTGSPADGDVGAFSVTVRARLVSTPSNYAEIDVEGTIVDGIYGQSFESCPGGFTFTGDWECADPTSGPADAFSPPACVGTNTYVNSTPWGSSVATSPVITLAGTTSPQLTFRLWSSIEETYDGCHLEISVDGGAFTTLTGVTPAYNQTADSQPVWGDFTSWTAASASLAAYAGDDIQLRWSMRTDISGTYPGCFIDDILISEP